jgi:uncharacterized membrane protein
MRVLRAGLAAFLLVMVLVPAAFAAGPLDMTTAYPSVVADPGAKVTFPVTVTTDTPQRVDLQVTQQPQGWTTRLRGAGSTIAAVETVPGSTTGTTASPGPYNTNYAQFTAEVTIPADAQPGANQVIIQGSSAGGTPVQLTLDISVEANQAGSVTLTTDFPDLTGATSTTFRFNLTLTNDTNQQVTFGLETDAPAGWTVTANPAGETQAASAVVDAGANTQVSVSAKAPSDAAAGTYNLVVRAVGGPQPVEAPLTVNVTGTFALSLATSDGRLNANVTAGSPGTLNLIVSNDGSSDLTGVTMSATPPQNWKVSFTPPTVDIAANSTATVQANITSASDALSGDYLLTIDARSPDNSANDSIQIRTTVDTSPIGYVIGIGILVVVGIGLFFVFQRYGRR